MKKFLSFVVVLFLCMAGLVGCGTSKVTYNDPATGEDKELKIVKTSDEKEVADSLYAVALSKNAVKPMDQALTTLTFKVNLEGKDDEGKDQKIVLNGKLEIGESIDKEADIKTVGDLIKAIKYSIKLEVSGTLPNSEGNDEKFAKSTVDLYLEEGVVYGVINLDVKLANYIEKENPQAGAIIKLVNTKTIKYDLNSMLYYALSSYSVEDVQNIVASLRGNGKTVKDILTSMDIDVSGLRAQIDEMVKEAGLTITKVSGSQVTYTADLNKDKNENKNSTITASVTINVSDMAFVGCKLNAKMNEENVKGTAEVTAKVSYKAGAKTISQADKDAAVDAMTLMAGK